MCILETVALTTESFPHKPKAYGPKFSHICQRLGRRYNSVSDACRKMREASDTPCIDFDCLGICESAEGNYYSFDSCMGGISKPGIM